MKTKQPPKAEKPELDRKEWDFRSIPKSEVEGCYIYEYAREVTRRSTRIFDLFTKWRAGWSGNKKTPQFPQGCKAYQEFRKIMTACLPDFPAISEDWFPGAAWQGLDEKVRSRLVKDVNNGPEHRWNSSPVHKLNIETMKFEKNVGTSGKIQYVPEPFRKEDLSQTERGFFAINWNYPDSKIKEAFAEWLSEQRKDRGKRGLTEIKYKPKGRGDLSALRLNWLAAARLVKHYPRKQLVDDKSNQKTRVKIKNSPYYNLSDLYEAAAKARKLLEAMSNLAGRN